MRSANAWLPGYIADYNRRFAVAPKDAADAHLAYPGTVEELERTLSVQVTRMLSKNLSCQYEHFDGRCGLLWKKRKLTYSVMEKPRHQVPVADSKTINTRVDKAVKQRNTEQEPAPNHPWRDIPIGKPANDERCATL